MKKVICGGALVVVSVFVLVTLAQRNFNNAVDSGHELVANPDDKIDPMALLASSAEACLRLKSIEYEFEQENIQVEGPSMAMPGLKATVRQERAEVVRTGLAGKYWAIGTISLDQSFRTDSAEQLGLKTGDRMGDFGLAYNGEVFQILRPRDRNVLVVAPPEPKTISSLRDGAGLATLGVSHFTDPAPFKRILEMNNEFSYLGIAEIAGVKCHVIAASRTVAYPNQPEKKITIKSRFYIGVNDLLPRRLINANIQSTVRITRLNQPIDPRGFTLQVPNGYSLKTVTPEDTSRLRSVGLLEPGTPAPAWKLSDPEGKEHQLSDYKGKVVLMDFWATWCAPCVASMPIMQALHDKYSKKDVIVLGISNREEGEVGPLDFMKKRGLTYRLLLNGDPIVGAYKAETLPTFYIIGRDGQIIFAKRGYSKLDSGELEKVLDQYLKDGTFMRTYVNRS